MGSHLSGHGVDSLGVVQPLRSAAIVGNGVEPLGAVGRCHHVNHLVVAVVQEVELVHSDLLQHLQPFLAGHIGAGIHGSAVEDDHHMAVFDKLRLSDDGLKVVSLKWL